MVVPLAIKALHLFEVLRRVSAVTVNQETVVGGISNVFAKMPVVATMIHEVDVLVDIAAILEPASFVDVETGGIVQALVGFERPTHVIQKFGNDVPPVTDVFEVRLVELPTIVVNLLDFRVGAGEEGDILFLPGCVIAKVPDGQSIVGQNICCAVAPATLEPVRYNSSCVRRM
jgi:hypothetical protein